MNTPLLSNISSRLLHAISKKYYLHVVLGAAFLVRVLWILVFDVGQTSDYLWYSQRALSIASGEGYVMNGAPTAYWPVGYPAFLGAIFYLFHNSFFLAKLINVLLATLTVYVFYRISLWVSGSEEISRLSALLLALYPNQLAYCSIFASEITFVFFYFCAIYFMLVETRHERLRLILSGILFAAAIMIKPIVLFFPFLVILIYKLQRNRFLSLILVYTPVCIIMILWSYRNYNIYKEVFFDSSNVGVNLLIGNNPYANGTYKYNSATLALIGGDPHNEYIEGKLSKEYAVRYILQHPVKTVAMMPLKVWHIFITDYDGVAANFHGVDKTAWHKVQFLKLYALLSQGFYTIIMFLSICGIWLERKKIFREYKFATAVIVFFLVMYMPFFGIDRFHYPIMAFFLLFSSITIHYFLKKHASESTQ